MIELVLLILLILFDSWTEEIWIFVLGLVYIDDLTAFLLDILRICSYLVVYQLITGTIAFCKKKYKEHWYGDRRRRTGCRCERCDQLAAELKEFWESLYLDRARFVVDVYADDDYDDDDDDDFRRPYQAPNQPTFQWALAAPHRASSWPSSIVPVCPAASARDLAPFPVFQPPQPAHSPFFPLTPMCGLVCGSTPGGSFSPMLFFTTSGSSVARQLLSSSSMVLCPAVAIVTTVQTGTNFLEPAPPMPPGPLALPPSEPPTHFPDLGPYFAHCSGPPPPMRFKWCPPKPPRMRGKTQHDATVNQQHLREQEPERDQDAPSALASTSDHLDDGGLLGISVDSAPPLSAPCHPEQRTRSNNCAPQVAPQPNNLRRNMARFWRRIRSPWRPGPRGQTPRVGPLHRALRGCLPCVYPRENP